MDDDAWFDDEHVSEEAELDRERRVRHERVVKKGFRDGVEEGTAVHQHAGFVAGYRSGLAKAKLAGFLEGCIAVRQALHEGSPEAITDAANSARVVHSQLRAAASPAHCISESSPPVYMDVSMGHENHNLATNILTMGSIAEEPEEDTVQDASQHLLKAQTAVRGFSYGLFPESIVF